MAPTCQLHSMQYPRRPRPPPGSLKALTRAELGDSLEEFLTRATTDKKLAKLMMCMEEALRTIAFKVRGEIWSAGKWQHVKETTEIRESKLLSPGNLRATFNNPEYEKLINYYVREKYTQCYTEGMVPDVNQIIVKERGIFTNVILPMTKAKLRLLFEVPPLALLIENAGGYSTDGNQSVLDRMVVNTDYRSQVAYRSRDEIIRFEETMFGASRLKAEFVSATA